MPYFIFAALWVVLDQAVKVLVRGHILYRERVDFLPGLDLTYVKNTGAAFSMFSSHTWVLALFSAVVVGVLVYLLRKNIFHNRTGQFAMALLLGGAVGNLIDRLLYGFVTDMFATTFINFAVFNVADIGVVVGGVLLCFQVVFHWKEEKKPEEQENETGQEETP